MKAVVIIIGRSTKDKVTLAPDRWGAFQFETLSLLARLGDYYRSTPGVGQMEGEVEENLTIFGQIHDVNASRLRFFLEGIGKTYNQDGVLLIVGDAEYVEARQ